MNEQNRISWPGWETVRLIGRGSFGTVYEIQRKLVDDETESAALKVISIPQNPSDIEEMYNDGYDEESITATFDDHLKSIINEYSLMQKMDGSANVVNCKDIRYIQHDNGIGWDIFIRMELLTPLIKALSVDISEETVIKIGKDICNALVLCQKHEIVHRDIKPQNIFVSPNGDYKLGDFGIAKTVEKTMAGTKIGTYKYMAPEVYNNQPYGSGADIYSLGLVLYWLLNERRMPFMPLPPAKIRAGQDEEARHRRLSGEKLPEPAHGSDALKQIVLKACAYDPKDRYVSAAAMLEDLNVLEDGVAPVVTGVVSDDHTKSYEDDKTTGPALGSTQNTSDGVPGDSDATVGPGFTPKPAPYKEPVAQEHPLEAPDHLGPINNLSIPKYVLIAVSVIAVIMLFLFLRSCDGSKGVDDSTGIESYDGSQTVKRGGWSDWEDELPAKVSDEAYEIDERTLYRSRTIETTTSTENGTMSGWELYDTVEANGEFGPWSEWSDSQVEPSDTREVETQIMYRYADKETTTDTSPTKEGWTQDHMTTSLGNYGSWSSWSTTAVSDSESRKVETKTQYRYRNISYSSEYTNWGSWSSWSFDRQQTSDLKKEDSRTVWGYYYYTCPNCKTHMHGWNMYCPTWAGGCGTGWITESMFTPVYSSVSWDTAGFKDWHGTGKYYTYIDGQLVFKWTDGGSGTQYRYATRSTQEVTNYGSWSSWGDTPYSDSSTREVQTRTAYRYCERLKETTYHFWRWGDWSEWSEDKVAENDNRQVESATFYRYRDQAEIKTYYFKRWSDWSDYSEEPVTASDTKEVQTKTQYRYKEK